jgi:hypothetical protein
MKAQGLGAYEIAKALKIRRAPLYDGAPAHIDIEGAAVFQNRRPDFALDSERSSCGCGQRHVG